MHRRCYDQNHKSYERYGGRGIKVCQRWHSIENFVSDMGQRPEKTSLDRIDNSGDYGPDNCRWATLYEQQNNRDVTRRVFYNGKDCALADAARMSGVSSHTIDARLKRGWSVERAIETPTKKSATQP